MLHRLYSPSNFQKASVAAWEMDDRDFYVDNTMPGYRVIMKAGRLAGGEYVVYDKTDNMTKCILCRCLLRDTSSITEHCKAQKHVHAYFVRLFYFFKV